MFLRRFYDEPLAQASYVVGCTRAGEALVVDANRDVERYLELAAAEGVRITHVTETHIHADYVSGSRELAERTGATLYLSAEGGPDWQYAFARETGAVRLRDGDRFDVGSVRIDVRHTPGHTPEHLTFLVTDTDVGDEPMGAFTGDFIFVGDVGRPDLLERAAHVAGTMESSARALFRSLRRTRELPDWLQLWPGHGAGSACGKSLGAVPQTTLGYERRFGWAFQVPDEDEFVAMVLAGQPEAPRYFAEMKRINREGPAILGGFRHPERLAAARLSELLAHDALVIDTRSAASYALAHVPRTIGIPLNRSFATWAGSLVPYDRDFYLIVDGESGAAADRASRELAHIGLDRLAGFFTAEEALDDWRASGRALASVAQIDTEELRRRHERGEVTLVDVRGAAEWDAGHIPGALHVPLGDLPDRAAELPPTRPIVLQCQGGTRSAIASSILGARGMRVLNYAGGFGEWKRVGMPIEEEERDSVQQG